MRRREGKKCDVEDKQTRTGLPFRWLDHSVILYKHGFTKSQSVVGEDLRSRGGGKIMMVTAWILPLRVEGELRVPLERDRYLTS